MKAPSPEGRRLRQLLPALRQLLAKSDGLGLCRPASDHVMYAGPGGAADETRDVILIHEPGFVTLLPELAALDGRLICRGLSIQTPSPSTRLPWPSIFVCFVWSDFQNTIGTGKAPVDFQRVVVVWRGTGKIRLCL